MAFVGSRNFLNQVTLIVFLAGLDMFDRGGDLFTDLLNGDGAALLAFGDAFIQRLREARDLFANLLDRGGASIFAFRDAMRQSFRHVDNLSTHLVANAFNAGAKISCFKRIQARFEGAHEFRVLTRSSAFNLVCELKPRLFNAGAEIAGKRFELGFQFLAKPFHFFGIGHLSDDINPLIEIGECAFQSFER